MTAADDMFTGFVYLLASKLDDHEARGADLAARMHLSRFHFDRIVSAVSGESPARFRRRVLLERGRTGWSPAT
jgi:AraC-like DNA-binding protein